MSQDLLDQNIKYLRSTEVVDFEVDVHRENVYHFIANSSADIGYKLSGSDIIFDFVRDRDRKLVEKEVRNEETGELVNKLVRDPAGRVDRYHIGILTEENMFFDYTISIEEDYYAHAHLLGISKLTIRDISPKYTFYDQDSNPIIRKYRPLDHLYLIFDEINEPIRLHGHTYKSNKTLNEISRNLFKRIK
ncbi:hypothetical protein QI345_11440 [Staphylococcus saprophyticus]|nr:hypothetical protein [Staphylococcus saprophyticus]